MASLSFSSILNSFYSFDRQKEANKWMEEEEEKSVRYEPQNFQKPTIHLQPQNKTLIMPHGIHRPYMKYTTFLHCADDIALLANTPNQAETLLHSLERAAAGIHKTKYMCFNQAGDISTLDGTSMKLVDKFTYLGSSVSSTEKDIGTRLAKAWTAIDKLSVIWRSDVTDKMKRSFFRAAVVLILLYGCTT